MEVVINRNGDVVSSKRGTFYAGSKNSKVIKLLADDNVFDLIPKQSRIVHINIVRPDSEQTGWVLMETREDGIYYYLLEDWELSVPGEIKICFEIVNTESGARFTTEEVFAIVKNGVIAQPVCKEDHTKLEGYYQQLNELAQKEYDVKVIDTYEIDFSTDGQKTAGLYKNYEHDVIDSVLSETEEIIYDTVVGVLQVSRVELTDDEEQKYVSQTETLFANGRAWVRELRFNETGLIENISEFQPLGYGAVGPRGYTGAEGPQGEQGKKGDKGSIWYSGQGQPSQSLGVKDDLYLRTDGDFNGFVYKKVVLEEGSEAIWKLVESIRGPRGERGERGLQGVQGIQGVQGVQGPIGPQGKDGKDGTSFDIWGKFTTLEQLKETKPIGVVGEAYSVGIVEPFKIYTWDVNTEDWVDIGSIQGPKGEQGGIGPQGPQGNDGPQGEQGVDGPEGPPGKQGRSFNARGEWNAESQYEKTDLVVDVFSYQGDLYYTKETAPQGTLPTNESYFGKMLSPIKNFTDEEKRKLEGIEEGAQKNPTNYIPNTIKNSSRLNVWELESGFYKITNSNGCSIYYGNYNYISISNGSYLFVHRVSSGNWISFTIFNSHNLHQVGSGASYIETTDSNGNPETINGNFSYFASYPVGAIYMAATNSSPASIFGGDWKMLPGNYSFWTVSAGQAGWDGSKWIVEDYGKLPNIAGKFYVGGSGVGASETSRVGGAIRGTGNAGISGEKGGSGGSDNRVTFNASDGEVADGISKASEDNVPALENCVYGKARYVQPRSIKIYAWQRIA